MSSRRKSLFCLLGVLFCISLFSICSLNPHYTSVKPNTWHQPLQVALRYTPYKRCCYVTFSYFSINVRRFNTNGSMHSFVSNWDPHYFPLTLTPLTWRIWWANNASRWQMGFNSVFKGLNGRETDISRYQTNKQTLPFLDYLYM